jgi:hypothetical protein
MSRGRRLARRLRSLADNTRLPGRAGNCPWSSGRPSHLLPRDRLPTTSRCPWAASLRGVRGLLANGVRGASEAAAAATKFRSTGRLAPIPPPAVQHVGGAERESGGVQVGHTMKTGTTLSSGA